ncbi:MAG: glycosyltransferase, partial [Trebonia sp.]
MIDTERAGDGVARHPSIGVVIPTRVRPSLVRSVASALAQTIPPDRIVLMVDGPASRLRGMDLPHDPRVVVREQVPARGPAAARDRGAREAGTELVGFLDDDYEWLPSKLARQLELFGRMRASGVPHPVIACRTIVQDSAGREVGRTPHYLIRGDQRVGDYLFSRRRVRPGESAVGASMILCEASLLTWEPFDVGLGRHEDWDWLLRV